jgi:hypothetical protein
MKQLKNPVGTSVVLMILVFLCGIYLILGIFVGLEPLAFSLAIILIGVFATVFQVYAVIFLMRKEKIGWRLLALFLNFIVSLPFWFAVYQLCTHLP